LAGLRIKSFPWRSGSPARDSTAKRARDSAPNSSRKVMDASGESLCRAMSMAPRTRLRTISSRRKGLRGECECDRARLRRVIRRTIHRRAHLGCGQGACHSIGGPRIRKLLPWIARRELAAARMKPKLRVVSEAGCLCSIWCCDRWCQGAPETRPLRMCTS